MKILGLWIVEYFSGSNSDFFEKAIKKLGHELDIVPITIYGTEVRLDKALRSKKYDMLFHVPYQKYPRHELIRGITKNSKTITLAWNCDDEWLWNDGGSCGTKNIANNYDYCVTSLEDFIERYHNIGQKNVILGQWGYSEDWKPKKVKKDIDVYFCGQKNAVRDEYFKTLADLGIKVVIEGPDYSGRLEFQDMINTYRRAKIALNFVTGIKAPLIYQQVKCRNFEIPALGTFLLSEWCPALDKFFVKDKEVGSFKTGEEAARKIKYYLANEEKREAIAKAGMKRCKEYSFENILKRVFLQVKGKK